jgi:hypothetical protein
MGFCGLKCSAVELRIGLDGDWLSEKRENLDFYVLICNAISFRL